MKHGLGNCILNLEQVSGRTSTIVTYKRVLELVGINVSEEDWKTVTLHGVEYRFIQILQGGNNLTVIQRLDSVDVGQTDIDRIIEYMDADGEGMVSLLWESRRKGKVYRNISIIGAVLLVASILIRII